MRRQKNFDLLVFLWFKKTLGTLRCKRILLRRSLLWGASYVQERFHDPFILEDAGLFVDALKGFPGVYSKYVFFTIGLAGILRLLEGIENRKAVFRSVYAYGEPGKKPIIIIGECKGIISTEEHGNHGFGYDPLFIPDGGEKTFGEMTVEEKNQFSHRGKALQKLAIVLKDLK